MTEIDFLYSCIIGLLEFNGTLKGPGLYRMLFTSESLTSISFYVAIVQGCYSGFVFILVSPLLFVQLVNLVKHTTTNERFAYHVFFI